MIFVLVCLICSSSEPDISIAEEGPEYNFRCIKKKLAFAKSSFKMLYICNLMAKQAVQ